MANLFLTLTVLAGLCKAVIAQTGQCTYPGGPGPTSDYSQNLIVCPGESMTISWTSTADSVDCWVYQDDHSGPKSVFTGQSGSGTYKWPVPHPWSGHGPDVFFLAMTSNGYHEWLFTCHYFNVSACPGSDSQAGVPASPAPAGAPAATQVAVGTASSSETQSSSTDSSAAAGFNISPGGWAGIGSGALAAVAAIAGLYTAYYRHRTAKEQQAQTRARSGPARGPQYHSVPMITNHFDYRYDPTESDVGYR